MPLGLGKVQRHFLLSLIHPTEALQEPRWLGILHDLCLVLDLGILSGLYGLFVLFGPDLCIFLCRPSLELLQQGFRWWLTDFGLALRCSFKSGGNFFALRGFACSRRQSLSVGSWL